MNRDQTPEQYAREQEAADRQDERDTWFAILLPVVTVFAGLGLSWLLIAVVRALAL